VSKSFKNILKIGIPLLLGFFLVWYSLSKVSFSELVVYFKNANYFYVFLGVFFGLLSHISRAYRWVFMMEPLGYNIKFSNSFMAVFSAYLINYTIPRAGEVARATIITNYEKVPFEKGFGTIVAERIADLIIMLLIVSITLFLQFEFIYSFLESRFNVLSIIIGLIGLFVVGVIALLIIKKSTRGIALKIKNFIVGLIDGALSIFKMKKKWAFIFHTFFIWIMYVLMFYVTTFAVPELNNVTLDAVLIGFILASFSIAATNGGIGSFPVAVVTGFTLFNLPYNPSLAFGWIMWTAQTAMIIICGGLSLICLPLLNKKK
tara:strand:- start:121 stop:1074 length:954 start_codon:yes stop_codon:yes gene_type:complete